MVDASQFSLSDFKKLYNEAFHKDIDSLKGSYNRSVDNLYDKFSESKSWKELLEQMPYWNQTYEEAKDYRLYNELPKIVTKTYESFVDKLFRNFYKYNNETGIYLINCKKFLDDDFPINWFEEFSDIIRTQIVVNYIDGVDFIKAKICELFQKYDEDCKVNYISSIEGYYALHIDVCTKYAILTRTVGVIERNIRVEMQLTTEMKIRVKNILHRFYIEGRLKNMKASKDLSWKNTYNNDEFKLSHIGHMLHFIEVVLVEIRDKKKGDKNESTS